MQSISIKCCGSPLLCHVDMIYQFIHSLFSLTLFKLFDINCQRLTHYAAIIHNIKELLPRDWRIHIVHTCREGNACADYLAKFGASHPETYSPLADPPDEMSLLLLADANEIFFSR
ncbi:unnamed protein product [Trifolium pratense]|uniref:Uncharacterized protein n=1 Tax=Trifolium pratense TaxID=57577 RepID=A0ACB0MDZ8_TRIPR|nr:unnamed protein product [Trifolium pratense]